MSHLLQLVIEYYSVTEKLEILDNPDKSLFNKRSEIISQCHHKNKYRLKTLASSMTTGGITWKDAFTLYQAEDCKLI